jgi:hypothetical protein
VKCHYHPRAKAVAVCSVCTVPVCKRCSIEENGSIYCDSCYADAKDEENLQLVQAEQDLDSDDYVDLEMMDLLDTEDDDGLF